MNCPYCPYFIDLMIKDPLFDTSILYKYELFEPLSQFILRNKEKIKLFITAYEKKDPTILTSRNLT